MSPGRPSDLIGEGALGLLAATLVGAAAFWLPDLIAMVSP
jgi:hypothetical protein